MKTSEISMFARVLLGFCLPLNLGVPTAYADFAFGKLVNLESVIPVIDAAHESIDCFSPDGLEMYIESDRPGGQGSWDFWVLRRDSIDDAWGPPENLGSAVNSPDADTSISISSDGLTLFFASTRPGGYGGQDIYVSTRLTRQSPWERAVNLGPGINGSSNDSCPWTTADGLELYFDSRRPDGFGNYDLWVTTRVATDSPWDQPVNLGLLVNSAYNECSHSLSPDGRILFFSGSQLASDPRPGGYGGSDLWMTRRQSPAAPWQAPVNLGSTVNRSRHDLLPRMSSDGSMLYFSTNSGNTWDNWHVPILRIVDFNGDGRVDGKDILIMTQYWGQDEPLCDIAPYAWGDGLVDVDDLKVLAQYIGNEVYDPTLIAHWSLDETGGDSAGDSAGENDATIFGAPAWQPEGGKVGGALALFGSGDYISAPSALNPADGPFSIFVWVKGGAPGQVIISQKEGANWLVIDPVLGTLVSELKSAGRFSKPLYSDVIITDADWHHMGLTWDGNKRSLYVDDHLAAEDLQDSLASGSGDLNIGCGKDTAQGTFLSGLIDDVRIYKRAVRP